MAMHEPAPATVMPTAIIRKNGGPPPSPPLDTIGPRRSPKGGDLAGSIPSLASK